MPPSFALTAEITDANGVQARWASDARDPGDRPGGLSFTTKRGEGFSTATARLNRRVDREYPDLSLFDDFRLVGADGTVAFEGRLGSNPRSLGEAHSMTPQFVGWMSHAKDRKFTEVYVDRDLKAWGSPSRNFTAIWYSLSRNPQADGASIQPDATTGLPSLSIGWTGAWTSAIAPYVDSLYDAGGGCRIARLWVDPQWNNITTATTNWLARFIADAQDDFQSVGASVVNILTGGVAQPANYYALPTASRFVSAELMWTGGTAGGSDGASRAWVLRNPAAYGDHSVPLRGATNPAGVYASDVLSDIVTRFCPKLNAAGVQGTTYVIPHLTYKERTAPFDAFLDLNRYHLWNLAVWEDRTLFFGPADLSDYDWEVRMGDRGVSIDFQGDSTEDLANGIAVTFTDAITGATQTLTPDEYQDLRDTDPNNEATVHGLDVWTELTITSPVVKDAALQIGRIALSEFNRPKALGSIRVIGYVRDRAGNLQPGWKVRAGDTIAITDHPNDAPRLIGETQWDHDSLTLTVGIDGPIPRLEAILDRQTTALQAANLS